ncbi:TPA: alpha-glucan family phosphorylase [Candidatus Falkowbacteria bacterium]|nr:alpha-glucan family phosphorylase [Candidatus Falkowbacteria bacterium]
MTLKKKQPVVAYFSMEIAVAEDLNNYAGGLGILAGDILKAAADQKFPMVGITLLNKLGYAYSAAKASGRRKDGLKKAFSFRGLKKMSPTVSVQIGNRQVVVGVWKYSLPARSGTTTPVYFLDTDRPENEAADRKLTDELYGGDLEYRLKQEIILGRAGVRMLRALGYNQIKKIHLNEGHGALAAVEFFLNLPPTTFVARLRETRRHCVFTTHTSLPGAQDIFPLAYLLRHQPDFPGDSDKLVKNHQVNFTRVALYFSAYANTVSRKHRPTVAALWPDYRIRAITNGVHLPTWTAPEFQKLYDKYFSGWRFKNNLLHRARKIPLTEIRTAHRLAKRRLLKYVATTSSEKLAENVFTVGFARRLVTYKRPGLLFRDIKQLLMTQARGGQIQIIYAGQAHPRDAAGQKLVGQIRRFKDELSGRIKMVFLEDYDMSTAKLLVAGVDLWLNTPLPPHEASGTSGMKAAANGVPQLSTPDGWWPEAYVKNRTGWTIKEEADGRNNLYALLEKEILPLYYNQPEKWDKLMRSVIGRNASFFNTERVLKQYIKEAYGR